MSKTIYIGGRLESKEKGNVVAGANAIKDDTKGKMQNVINKETDDELLRLEQSKQDNLNFDNTPTEDSTNPVTSGGVYTAEKALSDAIEAILLLIPSAATALNKLVDTNTMNSSTSTATATFRGTYNAVSDLGLTYQATHAQIEAALDALGLTADNNDYAFVQVPVSDQSQDIAKTERYKNNGTNWQYEYDLNTSGFTAAQWGAINSTITLALVQKLAALPTNAELLQALGLKQDVLTFDNAPTTDSNNPVKSGGIKNAIDTAVGDEATARENADTALGGLIGDEQTRAEGVEGGLNTRLGAVEGSVSTIQGVIPSGAASNNKLVDNDSMTTYIGTIIDNIDATFNVTSTDGHVTLAITQVNGVITSVQLTTSDIASAAALNLKASQADLTALASRVTTAEGNITSLTGRMTTAESDIDTLTALYNALQQSAPQVVEPTDTWPVSNPSTDIIYRVVDRVNTPPQYYSDYMWNGTSMVIMATYNNAVDAEPTKNSHNLVESGGVYSSIIEKYLHNEYKNTFTSSGGSTINFPLVSGEKYLVSNVSESTSIQIYKGSITTANLLLTLSPNEINVPLSVDDDLSNFILYRNSSVQTIFSIKEALLPERVEACEEIIDENLVSDTLSKNFAVSGNSTYSYSLKANKRYILKVSAQGVQSIGLFTDSTLQTLIAQAHTSANRQSESEVFIPNVDLNSITIYRAQSITTSVIIQEYKIPQAVNLLEENVNILDKNVEKVNYVTVKKNGTGDFTTIRGAIDFIQNASEKNKYCILVYEGIYNVLEDYTDAEIEQANVPTEGFNEQTFVGPKLTGNISIKGVGAKEKVILYGYLDTDEWSFDYRRNISTLNIKGNGDIENLTIIADNLRYCVHDDFTLDSNAQWNRNVRNVNFFHAQYQVTYGAGMQGGALIGEFINCDFGSCLGIHYNPDVPKDASILIEGCKGISAGFGDTSNNNSGNFNLTMVNNSFDYISITDDTTDHNQRTFINGVGNKNAMMIIPSGYKYSNGTITKAFPASGLSVGKVVKRKGTSFRDEFEVTTSHLLAEGVVVFVDSDFAYIQKSGGTTSNTLSLLSSGNVGDLLTVDSNGNLTFTDANQNNAIAIIESAEDGVKFVKFLFK